MDSSSLPTPEVSPLEETIDVDRMIGHYVRLRDHKRKLEAEHKTALKPINKLMDEVGNKLLAYMEQQGIGSVTTASGNAHQTTKLSATIRDGAAFREWVVANGEFDLVDWRANANRVFDYIKDHEGSTPPGVNPSSYVAVRVRSPNEKVED
jgi:hypothetical protein